MHHYKFPVINHIDDLLPSLEGREDFRVMDKGDVYIVCYMVTTPTTFPSVADNSNAPYLRECRGITFDKKTGVILSRPYHKFKNLFEDDEHQELVINEPHSVLMKEDGSMVHALKVNNELTFFTKKGFSSIAEYALNDLDNFSNVRELSDSGYTPIYEYVGRQKIVLEYNKIDFILTAIRHRVTGEYFTYDQLVKAASEFNVNVVKPIATPVANINNLKQFANDIDVLTGVEGVVLRYENGHMVKVKCEDYRNKHRVVGNAWALTNEKNIVSALLNDYYDDLIPNIPAQMLGTINRFATEFWKNLNNLFRDVEQTIDYVKSEFDNDGDRNKYICNKFDNQITINYYRACWRSFDTPRDVLIKYMTNGGYFVNGVRLKKIEHLWGSLEVDQFSDTEFNNYKGIISDANDE